MFNYRSAGHTAPGIPNSIIRPQILRNRKRKRDERVAPSFLDSQTRALSITLDARVFDRKKNACLPKTSLTISASLVRYKFVVL